MQRMLFPTMPSHIPAIVEPTSAHRTLVFALVQMGGSVGLQVPFLLEYLAAFLASHRISGVGRRDVARQLSFGALAHRAHVAGERRLFGVDRPDVFVQFVLEVVGRVALVTLERSVGQMVLADVSEESRIAGVDAVTVLAVVVVRRVEVFAAQVVEES
jgi:hypothetical protein